MSSRAWKGHWFNIVDCDDVYHLVRHKGARDLVGLCGVSQRGRHVATATGSEDLSMRCKTCLSVAARMRKARKAERCSPRG